MKRIYVFLSVTLLLIACDKPATRNLSGSGMKTTCKMYPVDAPNAFFELYISMIDKIYSAALTGKLTAYSDSAHSGELDQKGLEEISNESGTYQVRNPDNPDDPHDLIDETYINPFDSYHLESIGVGDKNIAFHFSQGGVCYFKRDEAEALLKKEEKWLMKTSVNFNGVLSRNSFKKHGKAMLTRISQLLYMGGVESKLAAYTNDSLVSKYTEEDISRMGVVSEIYRLINPETPDDPYNLTDTLISTPFNIDSLDGIFVLLEMTENESDRMSFAIRALAPSYKPLVAGEHFPSNPMFWVKKQDAENYLNEDYRQLLTILQSYSLRRKINPNRLDYYMGYHGLAQ